MIPAGTGSRYRRVEHLRGRKRWAEFEEESFGKIDALVASGDCLVDRVLDRVYAGCENLEIINWANSSREEPEKITHRAP